MALKCLYLTNSENGMEEIKTLLLLSSTLILWTEMVYHRIWKYMIHEYRVLFIKYPRLMTYIVELFN